MLCELHLMITGEASVSEKAATGVLWSFLIFECEIYWLQTCKLLYVNFIFSIRELLYFAMTEHRTYVEFKNGTWLITCWIEVTLILGLELAMFSVLSWPYLVHNFFLSCEVESLHGFGFCVQQSSSCRSDSRLSRLAWLILHVRGLA